MPPFHPTPERAAEEMWLRRALAGLPPDELPPEASLAHAVEIALEIPHDSKHFIGRAKQILASTFEASPNAWRILASTCADERHYSHLVGPCICPITWDADFLGERSLLAKPIILEGKELRTEAAQRLRDWVRLAQALAPFFDSNQGARAFSLFLPTQSDGYGSWSRLGYGLAKSRTMPWRLNRLLELTHSEDRTDSIPESARISILESAARALSGTPLSGMDPREAICALGKVWTHHGIGSKLFDHAGCQELIARADSSPEASFIAMAHEEATQLDRARLWILPWIAKLHLNPAANPDRVKDKINHLTDFLFAIGNQADFLFKATAYPGDRVLEAELASWEGSPWHGELQSWPGLREPRTIDGLVFKEILDSKELYEEGKNLRHCVGGYSKRCASVKSRIFSIRKANGEPISTLELRPPSQRGLLRFLSRFSRHATLQNKGLRNANPSELVKRAAASFVQWLDSGLSR